MPSTGKPRRLAVVDGGALSNVQALEEILDGLPVAPNPAQVALGRRLAQLIDADEPTAAMVQQYREWLAAVESVLPEEPDELDRAQ